MSPLWLANRTVVRKTMAKAPDFTTQRLFLKPLAAGDIDGMAAMDADPEVMRFVGEGTPRTSPQHRAELESWIDDSEDPPGMAMWTVRPLEKPDRYLGWIMLYPLPGHEPEVEIGWRFNRAAWGHGYASEAAQAVMEHGFKTVGLDQIVAVLDPNNQRSRRVCEKLSMRDAGICRAYDTDCARYVKENGGVE